MYYTIKYIISLIMVITANFAKILEKDKLWNCFFVWLVRLLVYLEFTC